MKNTSTPKTSQPQRVGIIPARSGSKRVPGKNFSPIAGQSLLSRAVQQAKDSGVIDLLIVSSDRLDLVRQELQESDWLKFHERSEKAASDEASAVDVVIEVFQHFSLNEGVCIYLQPTSPLRRSQDIRGAFEMFDKGTYDTVVSVSPVGSEAAWTLRVDNGKAQFLWPEAQRMRSQDIQIYGLNGAVYVNEIATLKARRSFIGENTGAFVMPKENALDIDTPEDWNSAKSRLEGKN